MSQSEINQVMAMLLASGFRRQQAQWMAVACPSIARCREVCGEERRRAK